MNRGFAIGDKVICILTGVQGIVEKFYCPTAGLSYGKYVAMKNGYLL